MKLADRYPPETQKIQDNGIYRHYHVQIDKAFRSPGDRHPGKERYDVDRFSYELSDEEIEFHEKLYIPSQDYGTAEGDKYLKDFFGSEFLEQKRIGKNEKMLIDFLRTDNRLLIVKAPIGWGKTVLLKHFCFYLIPKSEFLRQVIYPIYLSMDDNFNYFTSVDTPADILKLLYKDLLIPRLIGLTTFFTAPKNEDLWNYLKEKTDEFADLRETERDLAEIYDNDLSNPKYREQLLIERRNAKAKDAFYLCAARYMIDCLGKTPVIIFDNVDPLDIKINRVFLQEAVRLCEFYGFRVIISMRERTYDAIAAEPDGIFKTYPVKDPITLERRNIREYLQRRIQAALRGLKTEEYTYIDSHGKRYTQANADEVISSMLRILINKESAEFLDYITYHNLRQLNDLIKVYLATGFIEHHKLNRAVIVERITSEGGESPLWILLSSVLTANYETHFSKNCPDPHILRGIANLYCNRKGDVNRFFIRLHLLNFFDRENALTVSKIISKYGQLFTHTPSDLYDCIEHALHRLLECQLLVSPEFYKVNDGDVIPPVNVMEITDTGKYYLKVLAGYFEYLAYMKDDVEIPDSANIKDCVEVKDLSGRYGEIYNFLRFLYDQEMLFLLDLTAAQRKHFLHNFSRKEDNNPFTISTAVEKMIRFGTDRQLDTSKFEDLHGDMEHLRDNF